MNELETWKIWAITFALVFFILAGAEMRIRPNSTSDGIASAGSVTESERTPVITDASALDSDAYGTYSLLCAPLHSFNREAYTPPQGFASSPRQFVPISSNFLPESEDDNSSVPELNVTEQIFDNQTSNDATVAYNQDLLSSVPVFLSIDNQAGGANYANLNWQFDAESNDSETGNNPDSYIVSGDARTLNLALSNVLLNTAVDRIQSDGSVSSGRVNLLQVLNDATTPSDLFPSNPDDMPNSDASNANRDEELIRTQAAYALALDEAQAEMDQEAAPQQFSKVLNLRNSTVYVQFIGGIQE